MEKISRRLYTYRQRATSAFMFDIFSERKTEVYYYHSRPQSESRMNFSGNPVFFVLIVFIFLFFGISDVNAQTCEEQAKTCYQSCPSDQGCAAECSGSSDADCEDQCKSQVTKCTTTCSYNEDTCEAAAAAAGGKSSGGGGADKYGLAKTAGDAGLPNIGETVPGLIGKILNAFLGLIATIFFALMLYGGFTWMTARGENEKVVSAKKIVLNAILGLIVVASAYAITNFVIGALG